MLGDLIDQSEDLKAEAEVNVPLGPKESMDVPTNLPSSLFDPSNDDKEMDELMKSLEVSQQDLYKKELQKQAVAESDAQAESSKPEELLLDFSQPEILTKSETSAHFNSTNPLPEAPMTNEDDLNPFSDPFERLSKLDSDPNERENGQETTNGNLDDGRRVTKPMEESRNESNHLELPDPEETSRQTSSPEKASDQDQETKSSSEHALAQTSSAGEEFNPFTCPLDYTQSQPDSTPNAHAPLTPMLSDDDGQAFVDTQDTVAAMIGPTTTKPVNPAIAKIASIESQDETFYSGNDDSECFFDTVENPLSSVPELGASNQPKTIPEAAEQVEPKDREPAQPIEEVQEAVSFSVHGVQESEKVLGQQDSSEFEDIYGKEPPPDTDDQQPEATIPIDLTDNTALETTSTDERPLANELDEANHQVVTQEAFVNEILSINEQHLHATTGVLFDKKAADKPEEGGSTVENSDDRRGKIAVIQVVDFETEWSQLSEREKTLGLIAPAWLADSESDSCMKCTLKFTFSRRRHHCRACGLLFCSSCCHLKLPLAYRTVKGVTVPVLGASISGDSASAADAATNQTSTKDALSRVCNDCHDTIKKGIGVHLYDAMFSARV